MVKLPKPLKFDKLYDWLVVARDGEKFYVCKESDASAIENIEDSNLDILGLKTLLLWAIEIEYPLSKFVKLQKTLMEKYFE